MSFNDESEQYLVTAMLRPGTEHAKCSTLGLLKRIVPALKLAFPFAQIRIRADGGFPCPELFQLLEELEVEYLMALPENSVLKRRSRRVMGRVRRLSRRRRESVARFGETRYAARSWRVSRRVIYKAEVVRLDQRPPRDNCRYIVTNLDVTAETIYELYRERGDVENRIKELKGGLYLDRTSCTRF